MNEHNNRIMEIEVKPGEILTIKAKSDGEIEAVSGQKPKRNISKEAEWQKEKYRRFGFTVDKSKGDRFAEILESQGKTPLQWFKEHIEIFLNSPTTTVDDSPTTTVDDSPTVAVKKKRKPSPEATPEEVARWDEQNANGTSWAKLAKQTGRHRTGIAKLVNERRKKMQESD